MKSIRIQLNKTLDNHLKVSPPERSKKIYSDDKEKDEEAREEEDGEKTKRGR